MNEECVKCGFLNIEGKTQFFEAISDEKIISLCEKCAQFVDLPMIKRASYLEMKEGGRLMPKYDNPKNRQAVSLGLSQTLKDAWSKDREPTLNDLIDRNLKTSGSEVPRERSDLIQNYHWVLLRARRLKKLTQDQLARELQVPTNRIQSLEAGRVTFDDDVLIEKLEDFLGVNLFLEKVKKARVARHARNFAEGNVEFDKKTLEGLTVGDLQAVHEIEGKEPYWKRVFAIFKRKKVEVSEEKSGEKSEEEVSTEGFPFNEPKEKKKDLTQKEIDDLLYRRR